MKSADDVARYGLPALGRVDPQKESAAFVVAGQSRDLTLEQRHSMCDHVGGVIRTLQLGGTSEEPSYEQINVSIEQDGGIEGQIRPGKKLVERRSLHDGAR